MFDESKHPRNPKGSSEGGRFTSSDGAGGTHEATEAEKRRMGEMGITVQNGAHTEVPQGNSPPSLDEILGQEFKDYKGQAAIDKLMQEKQGHVKGAFHRDDIGDIDLLWGNDYLGLQHIIKHREAQGINIQDFIKNLAEVVENGNFRKKNDRGNFEFFYDGKVAIISPELQGNKITFLLTAFKTHSKK